MRRNLLMSRTLPSACRVTRTSGSPFSTSCRFSPPSRTLQEGSQREASQDFKRASQILQAAGAQRMTHTHTASISLKLWTSSGGGGGRAGAHPSQPQVVQCVPVGKVADDGRRVKAVAGEHSPQSQKVLQGHAGVQLVACVPAVAGMFVCSTRNSRLPPCRYPVLASWPAHSKVGDWGFPGQHASVVRLRAAAFETCRSRRQQAAGLMSGGGGGGGSIRPTWSISKVPACTITLEHRGATSTYPWHSWPDWSWSGRHRRCCCCRCRWPACWGPSRQCQAAVLPGSQSWVDETG